MKARPISFIVRAAASSSGSFGARRKRSAARSYSSLRNRATLTRCGWIPQLGQDVVAGRRAAEPVLVHLVHPVLEVLDDFLERRELNSVRSPIASRLRFHSVWKSREAPPVRSISVTVSGEPPGAVRKPP